MLLPTSTAASGSPAAGRRSRPATSVAHAATFDTPFGPFSAAVDAAGAVVATVFGDLAALRRRAPAYTFLGYSPLLRPVQTQVLAWCAGQRTEFDLPLAPRGTSFQRAVWAALGSIPTGTTVSYGELAAHIGRPSAARAVGRANATNPLCLLVPCHRVVGADGALTGFAFGHELKRRLLEHEAAVVAATRVSRPAHPRAHS